MLSGCTADLEPFRSLPNTFPLPTISPEPASRVTIAPSPTTKLTPIKPLTWVTIIYVVKKNVPSIWNVEAALAGWKAAKYSDFKLVTECPVAEPCVTIRPDSNLDKKYGGQTSFSYDPADIVITLTTLKMSSIEAKETMCHELGHVLGEPHIKGTHDTCLLATSNYPLSYRTKPTKLDLKVVDDLGHWQLEKMAISADKELDVSKRLQ